ncbi:MAG: cytochrome C oxidase subunit IV family protein [Elusimicrobia bacterium]|nr:cytochrome C oxidase subunit IV family protein [Elusimicrobiota bacterium]
MGNEQAHVIPYRTLALVWMALLLLTLALWGLSRLSQRLAVLGLLTISPFKAGLVLYVFMHLRYERVLLRTMVFAALAILVIFLALLFSDIPFR